MCGRFTLRAPASVVAEQFALFEVPPLEPRYNIAPSQSVAAVRIDPNAAEPRRELAWLQWGLVPSWAGDPSIGNRLINARAESAAQKPAFRTALRRRRCLVAADGFYEWQPVKKAKQPFHIRLRDGRPFGLAGLWEDWEGPDHRIIRSCTLLTTEANDLVRPIHDRMPVIVPRAAYEQWLDPARQEAEQIAPLLVPYPSAEMVAYPVCSLVNSPSHEDPRCVEPLTDLFEGG
ncbi:MAG: SOS response-associated peptidase [Thermoguttaceae bacterium]